MKDVAVIFLVVVMWGLFLATATYLCIKFKSLCPLFILIIPCFMSIKVDNKQINPIIKEIKQPTS
jgi:hypothetical protein